MPEVIEKKSDVELPSTTLRAVSMVLGLLMLLFIVVQYNDPDGLFWMGIYLIPAAWAICAALKPTWLKYGVSRLLLLLSILAAMALTYYYWPKTSGWWKQEIWWEVETAREGMGMMIVTVVLLVAFFVGSRVKQAAYSR